jgi:hypothetical protein
MIYLIWGLLNIVIIVYFLVICIKATRFLRQKIGLFAAIFFVVGLLLLLGQPTKDSYSSGLKSNDTKVWDFAPGDSLNSNATFLLNVELEENLISKKRLLIKHGKDIQGQHNIPISAYSLTTGFISGTTWKPTSISVSRTNDNNKFQYFVVGIVDWKLLGVTIYTQSKRFNGIVSTKSRVGKGESHP